MTYPLGWSVVTQMLIHRERWPGGYRRKSTPLVYPGQEVQPDQPVMRLEKSDFAAEAGAMAELPRLSLPSAPPPGAPLGDALPGARTNGQHMSELIPAGMRGRVVDITKRGGVVIESRAAVVQGSLGTGNQVAGILTVWGVGTVGTPGEVQRSAFPSFAPTASNRGPGAGAQNQQGHQQIPPGAILVIPGPLNFAILRQAMSSGVAAVVASSISTRDLEGFLRTDLVSLVNSVDVELAQAHLPPMTLLLTEGLGTIAMPARTISLLSKYAGSIALISGATSIRQGLFPELIISLPLQEALQNWHPVRPDPSLALGAQVRVCGGSHEGTIGEINYLFTHQQMFASGVRTRAARLRLQDGSSLVVPVTLLERIG